MRPVVVLAHGFVQNRLAFEVPDRSLVRFLGDVGFRVAFAEMRGRDGKRPADGFDVYLSDAAALVDELAREHDEIVWIGHSMGGLIGACMPERGRAKLSALVTIGAPVIPGRQDLHRPRLGRALVAWSRAMHRRGRAFPGKQYGRMFSSARRVAESPAWLPSRLWRRGSMEAHALDAALHTSFAYDSFAVFADLVGLVASDGTRAGIVDVDERVRSLVTPTLVVVGQHDELAPPAGARLLHERARGPHKELLEVDAGHIDLVVGKDAPRLVWDPIARFLRRHVRSLAR